MGNPVSPEPVKLFTGILYSKTAPIEDVKYDLEKLFGPVDYVSQEFDFGLTDYYESEMGPQIKRLFWSFHRLIDPSEIADIKQKTNAVELVYAISGKRNVNLDPGYMDFYKVVLASVKARAQKIYIGKGIYADPTLHYLKGKFHAYDWSLPDFKMHSYDAIFQEIRNIYKQQMRTGII
ncbi:DUF4416 family protein [bacterium]|nr:DUF4416 family protein [candidate division CSSED10-310 bacterium]